MCFECKYKIWLEVKNEEYTVIANKCTLFVFYELLEKLKIVYYFMMVSKKI